MRNNWLFTHLWRGCWSGLLGGTFGGIVIELGYRYFSGEKQQTKLVAEVLTYALLVGLNTGIAAQLGTAWFRDLSTAGRRPAGLFNELIGGMLAGAVGGPAVGWLGGVWFGPKDMSFISPPLLFSGALMGAILVCIAIVLYESIADWGPVLLSSLASFAIVALVGWVPFISLAGEIAQNYFTNERPFYASGGALLGLILGALMGAEAGLGLLLYRQLAAGFKRSEERQSRIHSRP